MKRIKLTVAVAVLTFLMVLGCNSSTNNKTGTNDAVLLKFNLQKGKTYAYSMDVDMDSEMQGQAMNTDMAFDYTLEVLDDKDTVKTVKTTYDRIKMAMNAGQMKLDFDTNEPQKDSAVNLQTNPMGMMSNMFYAMKGKSFEMKMNTKGEVIMVTGLAELQNAMMNSLTVDENVRRAMGQAFQTQFNEENIKKSFSQSFAIFPDKPVKVGDTWTKNMNMGTGMNADVTTTYKVKEITGDNVVLDLTSDVSMGGSKGTQTGTMKLNRNNGLVTEGMLEQKFTSPAKMTTKTKFTGREK